MKAIGLAVLLAILGPVITQEIDLPVPIEIREPIDPPISLPILKTVTPGPPKSTIKPKTVVYGDTYIAAVPRCIRPGLPTDVFVDVVRRVRCAGGACNVKVELMNKTTGYVFASAEKSVASGNPQAVSFTVPTELTYKQWNDNYYIRITGNGPNLKFQNGTFVMLVKQNVTGFLQTDKAIYKPGQIVNFRLFSMTPDLKINKARYNIEIRDPKGNRIRNDKNVYDSTGLVKGDLALSQEPVYGIWRITATTQGAYISKSFEVKEYVLPRIKVRVTPPPFIALTQDNADVTVSAKYTFGKEAKGKLLVTAKISPWWNQNKEKKQPVLIRQVDEFDGEHTFSFSMKDIKTLHEYFPWYSFVVEANLTESLTGKVASGQGRATIYTDAEKAEFIPTTANTFKPGLQYTAYVKVSQQDGTPIVGKREILHVQVQKTYYVDPSTLTTPKPKPMTKPPPDSKRIALDDGISSPWRPWHLRTKTANVTYLELDVPDDGNVEIKIPIVPKDAETLTLIATYRGVKRYWSANKAYSPSNTFIQMVVVKELLKPGSRQTIKLKSNKKIDSFSLMVISRGRVVMTREEKRRPSTRHAFSFELTSDMAPRAKLIVYYRADNAEIVPDVVSFNVLDPFKNKVSVGFSAKEVGPGDDVIMTVKADPFSLVATLVLDKRVLLLKTGNDITEEQVTNSLWSFDSCGYYGWWGWNRRGGGILEGGIILDRRRKRRSLIPWRYPYFSTGRDANSVFSDAGLIVLTDSLLYSHTYTNSGRFPTDDLAPAFGRGAKSGKKIENRQPEGDLQDVGAIRTKFPETWLFLVESADANGTLNVATKAPDSITSWRASAFAFNEETGFGISSDPGELTVVKPFFANLFMPYSVIRGEDVFIQVNVFNYLPTNQSVLVELRGSTNFLFLDIDENGNEVLVSGPRTTTILVPSGVPKSVVFPIKAVEIGDIEITATARSAGAADGLTKTLRVKAEGVPDEYNYAELIDLSGTSSFTATRTIGYPPNVVDGSQRLSFTLVGDILGRTVENLANLVRMSYGCGEQNMVNFAPTVFVSKYLEDVGQLTAARRATSVRYIDLGFQRQMRYRRTDGSFSGFGERDKEGSLWLTAFVAKSFSTAIEERFIDIDEDIFQKSYVFISAHQLKDGSFESTGKVHNTRLQGQSGAGTRALTAYTLTALLENTQFSNNENFTSVIDRARTFVEGYVETTEDLYDLAIGAYALTLAGSASSDKALERLEEKATDKDGYTYWSVDVEPKYKWEPPRRRSQAATIETTSYVCLVYALKNETEKGSNCMAWLISQQNDYGGFVSTQDTVVAVQALSALGPQFYSKTQAGTVTVVAGGESHTFTVNNDNRLELQTAWLPVATDSVTVTGSGSGVFLVSISAKYHIMNENVEPAFKVSANLISDTPTAIVLSFCASYLEGRESNMANIEIRLPSGFELDGDSKAELEEEAQRVEVFDGKVLLYFDTITEKAVCLSLSATGSGTVNNAKPCAVRVFDYYSPDKSGLAFYKMKSLEGEWCDSTLCAAGGCSENCTRRRRK